MAAQRYAEERGCDDVILVSSDGAVLEAPTSSVVWSVGRRLYTVAAGATGILASTTQRLLFDRAAAAGWQCSEVAATVDDLHASDVVWLVGSVRGPVDVVELDGVARARRPEVDAEIRALAGFPVP
jgi:4-amino-4-deoxychorismate lyase